MLSLARRQPSAILLAAQLAGVLLYPFMEGSDVGRALFSAFGIAILGLVVLAARGSPAWIWVGLLLGLPATVLLMIQAVTGGDDLVPYSSALEAILYFYAAGALIGYMLADRVATSSTPSAPPSPWWLGDSLTRSPSARRSSPGASRPPSTRRPTARGWSSSSSASRTSRAPA